MADNGVLPTEAFVKKIPNPSGSGVAYFKATAPSLANTPKMSTFRKQKKINNLTKNQLPALPRTGSCRCKMRHFGGQYASYWFAICGILPRSLRHFTCPETISDHVTEHLCRPRGLSLMPRMPIRPIVRALKRRKS